jgi:hypothetical protein
VQAAFSVLLNTLDSPDKTRAEYVTLSVEILDFIADSIRHAGLTLVQRAPKMKE